MVGGVFARLTANSEPCVNPYVGICAGAIGQLAVLPRWRLIAIVVGGGLMSAMNTKDILVKLGALKPEMAAQYKVREIGLFGSFVREEQGGASMWTSWWTLKRERTYSTWWGWHCSWKRNFSGRWMWFPSVL
jgi:hypothetical protein